MTDLEVSKKRVMCYGLVVVNVKKERNFEDLGCMKEVEGMRQGVMVEAISELYPRT